MREVEFGNVTTVGVGAVGTDIRFPACNLLETLKWLTTYGNSGELSNSLQFDETAGLITLDEFEIGKVSQFRGRKAN